MCLKHFGQFARFIHFTNDVTAANKFAFYIKLWDRWPIRIGLDAFTDIVIFQHIYAAKFYAKMRFLRIAASAAN